jgi:hypothetical protein
VAPIFFSRAAFPEETASLEAVQTNLGAAVFGIDLTAPAEGVEALVAARRKGVTTAVFPILPDPFERTLGAIGKSIAATPHPDTRMDQFIALRIDQLLVNGMKPTDVERLPETHENAAALVLRLADVILMGAPGERDRWNHLLARIFRRFALLPAPAREAPAIFDETGVTLFAPSTDTALLAPLLTLLDQRRIEPRIISASNPHDPIGTRVVLAPEWRALRARALAGAGHHVVTPNTTRVDECDSRIFGYHPVDYRSFLDALDAARCATTEAERLPSSTAAVRSVLERDAATGLDGPRISIVVRTYNRPTLLKRAVASLAAQTYRNVEIVVVNNGGSDVADVLNSASGARPVVYEVMPERKHIGAASNVGARAATGTYVGYLDDDDLLYGDHCARTVEILQRTHADLGFTMCLGEYAEMRGDEKRVLGYQIYLDRPYHRDDIYISNVSPIHSIVHRKALFDRVGYFDESLPVTDDWELWLRLVSNGGTVVRIDRVTCEYSWRYDPQHGNMTVEHQWDFVRAYETIIHRYAADVANRPSIRTQQANMLAQQRSRAHEAQDPQKRAGIVIGSMHAKLVPVSSNWQSPQGLP